MKNELKVGQLWISKLTSVEYMADRISGNKVYLSSGEDEIAVPLDNLENCFYLFGGSGEHVRQATPEEMAAIQKSIDATA